MTPDEEFYDDWRATEVTHDYFCPVEAEAEARLEQIERKHLNAK